MRTKTTFLLLMIIPMLLAWKPSTAADAPSSFFSAFAEIAQNEMRNHDIPASIKLGQAALESGWGKSELAVYGNNYFGIKCRNNSDCTNRTYKMKDDDYDANGNLIKSTFMAFNTPQESFYMHSQFLTGNMNRYGKLFDLPRDDYKAWARGLQDAGYATAKDYADNLIKLIEKYQLYKYDQQVINNSFPNESKVDALNALAEIAQPSNPVKEKIIEGADENGSFGSRPILNQPLTYTENPAAPTEETYIAPAIPTVPVKEDNTDTWTPEPVAVNIEETPQKEIPQNIFEQNFGSEDVTDYVPDSYKDLFAESEKGTAKQMEKLDNVPDKKMIGGDSQPR